MLVLGFDTSNYTTSAAAFGGETAFNCSKLLPVRPGALGLRQSDALFEHVRQLPQILEQLTEKVDLREIRAIGVSTRPRAVEGSYMPCFLAGESQASVLASTMKVPLYRFSHQQGHIAASVWSAGRMELLDCPHLAWHLSGGTTELLYVQPDGVSVKADRIGGTEDISAGQLIDRTGKLLGLPFPAGKALDALSQETDSTAHFRVKLRELSFSFSGVQNQVESFASSGRSPEETARFALLSVIGAVAEVTKRASHAYPGLPVVFSGGVASNSLLRKEISGVDAVFALPEYSTDNAMGIAILTERQERQHGYCNP